MGLALEVVKARTVVVTTTMQARANLRLCRNGRSSSSSNFLRPHLQAVAGRRSQCHSPNHRGRRSHHRSHLCSYSHPSSRDRPSSRDHRSSRGVQCHSGGREL